MSRRYPTTLLQMPFDKNIKIGLRDSLNKGLAVAVYRRPGSEAVRICGSQAVYLTDNTFKVTPWNELCAQSISITNEKSVSESKQFINSPLPGSTPIDKYLDDLSSVISRLKANGGKTVISRTIHVSCPDVDWIKVAERLFDRFPEALCYVFYHPVLGAWMGATPELLLRTFTDSRNYETMALAGTKGSDEQWDDKNRDEQRMVVDYITDTLYPLSDVIHVDSTETLRYGVIEHLCTKFYGKIKADVGRCDILDHLSPTPAVGGYPKATALAVIDDIEDHDRGCYGGYLTFSDGESVESYVILRCIRFDNKGYTAYTGSGITAMSDPEKEWLETEAKAAPLIDIVESVINEGR